MKWTPPPYDSMTDRPRSRLRIHSLGLNTLVALLGVLVALLAVLYVGGRTENVMSDPVLAALALGLVLILSVWDLIAAAVDHVFGEGA